MSWPQIILSVSTALIGLAVYVYQRTQDRKYAIMAERRAVYAQYLERLAPSMYLVIDVSSREHLERERLLNEVGGKISVLAPSSVVSAHSNLAMYLLNKRKNRASDEIEDYFDEEAERLLYEVTKAMRADALPNGLN